LTGSANQISIGGAGLAVVCASTIASDASVVADGWFTDTWVGDQGGFIDTGGTVFWVWTNAMGSAVSRSVANVGSSAWKAGLIANKWLAVQWG